MAAINFEVLFTTLCGAFLFSRPKLWASTLGRRTHDEKVFVAPVIGCRIWGLRRRFSPRPKPFILVVYKCNCSNCLQLLTIAHNRSQLLPIASYHFQLLTNCLLTAYNCSQLLTTANHNCFQPPTALCNRLKEQALNVKCNGS